MDNGEKLVNIRYKGRRMKTKKHKNIAQHIKLKRWAARTLQNTEDESRCSRRVSSSLYDTHISSNRRVPFFFFFSFFLLFFLFFFFFCMTFSNSVLLFFFLLLFYISILLLCLSGVWYFWYFNCSPSNQYFTFFLFGQILQILYRIIVINLRFHIFFLFPFI
jgi:Flp pilus assembly protein TadB